MNLVGHCQRVIPDAYVTDEVDLDTLCDLLEDQNELTDGSCQLVEPQHDNNDDDIADLQKEMDIMKAKMLQIEKQMQVKRLSSTDQKASNKQSCRLKESEVNLFATATATTESDEMSKEMKTISMITDEDNVNPYIQTPELTESGKSYKIKKSNVLELPKKVEKIDQVDIETFSNIRILNRVVSSSTLKERMKGRKMIRISTIQSHIHGGDVDGDWVTMGVIINKSETKTSKNGKNFSIWKLSDLNDCDTVIKFFLFGDVNKQHWKTTVGSVIGILNASIMDNKDHVSKEICITVDNSHKVMLIGVSKDFGLCKSKRKDGHPCSIVVNKNNCEYCQYHVKSAYQKLSSKRTELQASYSGVEPRGLKNKLLKNQQIMYGGQSFTVPSNSVGSNKKIKKKDKVTLGTLGMQKKAEQFIEEEKSNSYANKSFSPSEQQAISSISKTSKNLHEMMTGVPSIGSRNLLRHLVKEDETQQVKAGTFKSISAKDLLKMHQTEFVNKNQSVKINNTPKIGAGLVPGRDIDLDIIPHSNSFRSSTQLNGAKLRAVRNIQRKGELKKTDPNTVKVNNKSESFINAVKTRIEDTSSSKSEHEPPSAKRNCLEMDRRISSVDINKIINQKSRHENEANTEQADRMETYFGCLEKKEQMEEKMISTKEVMVTAVSCHKCNYTSYHQSDMCRGLQHVISRHKAKKRFFRCVDCKKRTTSLTKLPTKACRHCNGNSFERVGMWEEKCKENDKLFITDEQTVFKNSGM
ncbi:Protein MCM10 [Nymphon striatum]|nr:Protein MCM10 [Nymphon striatum]